MADNTKNKVKFNIKNCHYAVMHTDEQGVITYDTPVALPGAVSLSLSHVGDPENFYADGYAYYIISNNQGYEGDLELAIVPQSFRVDVLKEYLDTKKVLFENANSDTANFALLFEFDGDKKSIRHCLYYCAASRPEIEGQTNEETKTPQTEKVTIKAAPRADGLVKGKTGDDTDTTTYDNWYKAVTEPVTTQTKPTTGA